MAVSCRSSSAEILAPVDVYTVPTDKYLRLNEGGSITVKNLTTYPVTFDLAFLNPDASFTDNIIKNDEPVAAGQTITLTAFTSNNPYCTGILGPGVRIAIFPSAVDIVEVKVYGTETSI